MEIFPRFFESAMSKAVNEIYEFGEFRLESAERRLLRAGEPISLTSKAFEILLALVQNSGHVIGKDDLMKQVWADTVVEEINLARNIWTLRKALGEGKGEHAYIETVPKVGYRFCAPVTQFADEVTPLVIQRRIRAQIVHEEVELPEAAGQLTAGKPRRGRWAALGLLLLIALTTTIIVGWGRMRATPPTNSENGFRRLTDGRQDDNMAYWTDAGEIYFSRHVNSRLETWKMNADGTNQHRANTEIKNLLVGHWSPDGNKVVFVKENNKQAVYLADGDGANEIALPFVTGNMDWSPDSAQFVYEVRTGEHNGQIFLYTIKTRQNVALTDNQSLNADPSFSPDGKKIVFVSDRDKNVNIYVMQADGSNLRRLTDDLYFDNYPVFSPDGTQIAFQSNREDERVQVYLKNINDDSPPRRLTHLSMDTGIAPKCWSSDGTQILLYTNQNGKDQIVLADVEPPAKPLLSDDTADLMFPRLSKDGNEILYVASMADHSLELRWSDLVTKRTRTIYRTPANPSSANQIEPAWSPDNSLIAFSTKVNGNSDVFSIRADGTGLKNLTNNPARDSEPIFSPDGSEIIFARDNYGKAQLYRMDLNGGNQRRLTNRDGYEQTPAFSPDGAYLAFAADREGHGLDIFLLPLKNPDDEKIVAARRSHDTSPAFSPDGKRIAFIATSDGNPEIYLMNSDGSGLFRLTRTKADETRPQFSKDGRSLFFAANRNQRFAIYTLPVPQ